MARPRARIDTAALADAFSADGLHGTSSTALAAGTGVAKPTLYVHGDSKEALFLRAVEAEVERVLDRLHAAAAATGGRSARYRATAAARALLDHAAAHLLARTARHESSNVAEPVARALRRVPDHIATSLRHDLREDGLDPSLAPFLARCLHGAATGVAEVRAGEPRPARARLAAIAASVVPEPAATPAARSWPTA